MTGLKAMLETLKVIRDSQRPISIESIRGSTGFDKRKTQRHAKLLVDAGLVKRIGDHPKDGYAYKILPNSGGLILSGYLASSDQ